MFSYIYYQKFDKKILLLLFNIFISFPGCWDVDEGRCCSDQG